MVDVIVVGTDGSDRAQEAVTEAVRLGKALGADLHILSAYHLAPRPRVPGAGEARPPLGDEEVDAILAEAASTVRLAGIEAFTHAVREDPADALLAVAGQVGATMIVVGSKGMHGARRLALGNVPKKVSHHAHCSVLIVATGGDAARA